MGSSHLIPAEFIPRCLELLLPTADSCLSDDDASTRSMTLQVVHHLVSELPRSLTGTYYKMGIRRDEAVGGGSQMSHASAFAVITL